MTNVRACPNDEIYLLYVLDTNFASLWNICIWNEDLFTQNFKNGNVFNMCVLYFPDGISAIKLRLDVCSLFFSPWELM